MSEPGREITAAELTKAAFSGVLAALKEQDFALEKFPGPILAGIIAWPELSQFREGAAGSVREG
ncbi:hypothetical protein ACXR2U_00455 [Jatrophihabitans sp. YIM 134969]